MPSGRFLMEEFYYAGGLPAVLRRLGEANLLPHPDALTVNGRSLWDNVREAPNFNDEVIRPLDQPLIRDGGIRVLRGNLAPRGAVLKPSAATPSLLKHRGRAVVFENLEHYKARIVDESLDVDADSILVMKNCGPKGYPGMAEVGNMGLPPKLLRQGVKDMVRISDARMSGTAYGTVVLHVAPEAAAGGRWPRCATVTGSNSIARPAPCTSTSRRRNWPIAWSTSGRRRQTAAQGRAGISGSTWSMCCRPTRAAISTSWSDAAAPRCRGTRTDPLAHQCLHPTTTRRGDPRE